MVTQDHSPYLGPDDPHPVVVDNAEGRSPFLLTGDHAGIAVPAVLGTLGVGAADMARHIACDIGVQGLGRALANRLDAAFIHQAYSRLVIDCNRDPASPEAVPEETDGTVIPGNIGMSASDRLARVNAIHAPYQDAIAARIAQRATKGQPTVLIALHSFTPVMAGQARPWQVGVLHDRGDSRFALGMLATLQAHGDLIVGDNAPYRMDATDHSVPRHAYAQRLPYAELEIRQDLIATADGQARWGAMIAQAMEQALRAL